MFASEIYAYTNGFSKTHPLERFLFAFLTFVLALFNTSLLLALGLVAAFLWFMKKKGQIPSRYVLGFMALPLGFLVVGVATLLISFSTVPGEGTQLFQWGPYYFYVTWASLILVKGIIAKVLGALAALAFLVFTTPMGEIGAILAKLRLPPIFLDLIMLTYRFIFVLQDTALQIQRAQVSRWGYVTKRRALKSFSLLIVNLLQKSLYRSRQLTLGLTARCYGGSLLLPNDFPPLSRTHLGQLLIYALVLGLLVYGAGGKF